MSKLPRKFYERSNVVLVAKDLLGKHLCVNSDEGLTIGRITEVEAYSGRNDKACHANNGLRTNRTEVMYGPGGYSYVYLCYGIHHLFNVVTNKKERADAVLIRAIEPMEGMVLMLERRKRAKLDKNLCSGPGTLSKALGINFKYHYGLDLLGDQIWIEDQPNIEENEIEYRTRIGVDYAEEDALKLWRFYIKNNKWISRK